MMTAVHTTVEPARTYARWRKAARYDRVGAQFARTAAALLTQGQHRRAAYTLLAVIECEEQAVRLRATVVEHLLSRTAHAHWRGGRTDQALAAELAAARVTVEHLGGER